MNPLYACVAQRAGKRCEYCHAPESVFNFHFELEHISPLSLGGVDTVDNLALACRSCNLFKSNQTMGVDPETKMLARLYQPREDNWHEHFRTELQCSEIVGITPIGRATIDRLQLNSEAQLSARSKWVQLGLFP